MFYQDSMLRQQEFLKTSLLTFRHVCPISMLMLKLGQFIRQLREGLTQQEVARRAGVDDSLVSFIESEKPVRFDTLKSVCKRGLQVSDADWQTIRLLWLEQVSDEPVFCASLAKARKTLELREADEASEFLEKVVEAVTRNLPIIDRRDLREPFLAVISNSRVIERWDILHDLVESFTNTDHPGPKTK